MPAEAEPRTAVVVGGDAIAHACVSTLLDRGYQVLLAGASPLAAVDREGVRVATVDVDDAEAAAAAVAGAASGWTAVHALVNCHFHVVPGSSIDVSYAEWEHSMRVNVAGPLLTTRALLPLLKAAGAAGGASVVHLGSVDGTHGNPTVAAYSAAKGALVPLTHVMAHDLAPFGIRVNCVARALVATPGFSPPDTIVTSTPLKRAADPSEIAGTVAFLLSDEAAYITGTVLTIDGGRTGITRGTA